MNKCTLINLKHYVPINASHIQQFHISSSFTYPAWGSTKQNNSINHFPRF